VSAPAVQQVGGAVIVQGAECLQHLKASVLALMREMQANGYAPPPALADLLIKAHAAGVSDNGHEFATYQLVQSDSNCQDASDWIDVAEAARILGVSERQARRLAQNLSSGEVKRIGNTRALRKAPVLALAERRRSRR
jgi:ABC-type dipeptide/oligopeptide/nickel transport system ATPase subunit